MIISKMETIGIIGGANASRGVLESVFSMSTCVIAADGGADHALGYGICPDYVIGDLDSLSQTARDKIDRDRVIFVDDQDSTDFDKVLMRTDAPLILGAGFLGDRIDHQMAVQTSLTHFPDKKVVLFGEMDILFLCPPDLELDVPIGTRVSLYPMAQVRVASTGLNWATDDLIMTPDGRIGTSNHAVGGVTLKPDCARCLVILPRETAASVIPAIARAPHWSVRAK